MPKPPIDGRPHSTCLRTRLTETPVAAIDYCQCGHMHLHLGPFSMRLSPEALTGLRDAIELAMASHRTAPGGRFPTSTATAAWRRGGDA